MATETRKTDNGSASKTWFVRNEQGGRFGPVDFETVKAWARDGRIGPTNEISGDGNEWRAATSLSGLEMDWVAEVTSGNFYGPIHRDAMQGLLADGSISKQAALFRRTGIEADRSTASQDASAAPPDHAKDLELSRHAVAELNEKLRLAQRRVAGVEQETVELRQSLAEHSEQARRSVAALEALLGQAQQQIAAKEADIGGLQQQVAAKEAAVRDLRQQIVFQEKVTGDLRQQISAQEVTVGELQQRMSEESAKARQALAQEQQKALEREQRAAQSAVDLAEAIGRLDAAQSEFKAQAAAWASERRSQEILCQSLRDDATRALAETATRTARLSELEGLLKEARADAEREREAFEQSLKALRSELSAAQESAAQQRLQAQKADEHCAALSSALEATKQGCDSEHLHLERLSRELADVRLENARLLEALQRNLEEASARAVPKIEVLEAEPLEPLPKASATQRRRPQVTLDAEVMSPERPGASAKVPPHGNPAAGPSAARGKSGLSLAELEQQARRELERLGAHGPAFFSQKK